MKVAAQWQVTVLSMQVTVLSMHVTVLSMHVTVLSIQVTVLSIQVNCANANRLASGLVSVSFMQQVFELPKNPGRLQVLYWSEVALNYGRRWSSVRAIKFCAEP